MSPRGRCLVRALVGLLAAAVLVAAPAGGQSPPEPAPLVRIPFPQDDGTLTPYTFELGYPLMTLVYDTLLWRDSDGLPQPWLARSVDTSADGRRVTLRLAEGVRWHDGMDLTASDVAFTFRFMADHPHPRFTASLEPVEQVLAPDATTVEILLRRASPGFTDQPLADLPILPAHIWGALAPGALAPPGLPMGSGPYRLVDHAPGRAYRFEANDGYFRGPPSVATIEVPILPTAEETLRALRRRRVDVIPAVPLGAASGEVRTPGTKVGEGVSYAGTVLMFNVRAAPFDRPEVRGAIASALDLDRMARTVGDAVPADRGYLHPASRWSADEVLHAEDPATRQTLAGLGLPPIEVLAPDNDPVRVEAGRQVALALRRAGVAASSRALPRTELAHLVGEDGSPASFQVVIWGAPSLASHDPDFLRRVFGSDAGSAPFNYSGYASAAFDDLAELVASTSDPDARQLAVVEQLRLLARDLPVVPLFFSEGRYAYRPAIHDDWVYVKGSGILDKRSFTEPVREPRTEPETPATPTSPGPGALGLLGLAAVAAAVLRAAWLVSTTRRDRQR